MHWVLVALLLALISQAHAGQQTYTTAGASTWTAPANVTSVVVEVWGGGGAGGGNPTNSDGGGGYSRATVTVVPATG